MTRVLHVDAGREWRGGQVQLAALAVRTGAPVVLHPDAPLRAVLERAGVEVFLAPFHGRVWGALELRAAVRRYRPAIVAAHDGHGAALASRSAGAPLVIHRRVDFAPSLFGARRFRRAAAVIAVSEAVARVVRFAGAERVMVVHDGVDPAPIEAEAADRAGVRATLGVPSDTRLALAVGALVEHKAHHLMVRALAALPGIHGVVLGEGPLRGALASLATSLGVRLHLPGHRPDVARWLKSVDVFVHPSTEEGLGQAVIEAAFARVPMVISQAGGLPELGLGVPVSPGNVEGLARAIRHALGGVRSVDRADLVARFGIDRMVRQTAAAYVNALGS